MNLLYSEMLRRSDPGQVAGLSRFFKTGPGQYGYGDQFLGIKVPVTREVVKACWKELDFNDLEECIACQYHEVRLAALLSLIQVFAHSKKDKARQQACIDFYLAHTDRINNWDLVDLSCYPLLGEWLLDKDRTLLYDLARNGKTLWEQRIGMVSTMTFIRHGQLEDTFAIADILLHHSHDLIHKAVGWLLREAGKKDKNALEKYLKGFPAPDCSEKKKMSDKKEVGGKRTGCESAPRYQSMPRTMLRYAIEKFPEAERLAYLNGRAS